MLPDVTDLHVMLAMKVTVQVQLTCGRKKGLDH